MIKRAKKTAEEGDDSEDSGLSQEPKAPGASLKGR